MSIQSDSLRAAGLRAERLRRLGELADQRARRVLGSLQSLEDDVRRLQGQRTELKRFALGYQQVSREGAAELPALLHGRRRFVASLQREIDELDVRLRTRQRQMQERRQQHRRLAAEALAVESMARRLDGQIVVDERRAEQRRQDDMTRSRRLHALPIDRDGWDTDGFDRECDEVNHES